MNVRILVADEREANFYDAVNPVTALRASGSLWNETARMQDRELETDRAGRRSMHPLDGERSTHRHQTELFAKQVARTLDTARSRNEYERLVLIAGPRMLGLLREALPENCRANVAAEIPKDLVHQDEASIRSIVPREVFWN